MNKVVSMLSRLFYAQGILALTGIVRVKVLAISLGPEKVGAYNQILNACLFFYMLATFGLSAGISRNVAAADTQEEKQNVLSVANYITVVLSATAFVLCLIPVLLGNANGLFGLGADPTNAWMLLILVGLGLFEAWRNNYYSVLQGLNDVKGIGPERAYGVFAASILTLPLVFFYGIWGAVVQTGLITIFQTLVHGHRVRHLNLTPLKVFWKKPVAQGLFGIGLTALIFFACDRLTDLILRSRLELAVGLKEMGFLATALSLSGQIKGIITTSVATYAVANVSKAKTPEDQSKAVTEIMTVLLPVTTYMMALLTFFAPILIPLLSRKDFSPAIGLVGILVAADFCLNSGFILITPMLAQKKLKEWLTIDLTFLAVRVTTGLLLIPHFGVKAFPYGALTAGLIYFSLSAWGYHRISKLSLSPKLIIRFGLGLAAILGTAVLVQMQGILPKLAAVAMLGALFAFDVLSLDLINRAKRVIAQRRSGQTPESAEAEVETELGITPDEFGEGPHI